MNTLAYGWRTRVGLPWQGAGTLMLVHVAPGSEAHREAERLVARDADDPAHGWRRRPEHDRPAPEAA